MADFPSSLPADFLLTPAPNLNATRLDFSQTPLSEYKGLYAVVIDNVLTPTECAAVISAAEATTNGGAWERALVNVGGGRQERIDDIRSCSRIIWDQAEVVERIWKRVENVPEVKEILKLQNCPKITGNGPAKWGEVWRFTRPNERMRMLKYEGGEYFKPHWDGSYATPDGSERSYFTLHLYLNSSGAAGDSKVPDVVPFEYGQELNGDGNLLRASKTSTFEKGMEEALVGGATTFHAMSYDEDRDVHVRPRTGRVLIFQHRGLLHSGQDVVSGEKSTMRTDLMYELESSQSDDRSFMAGLDD